MCIRDSPNGVRAINHSGAHYNVKGPLNLPRSPQGRPVFVQAGSSDTGKRFAARHAEAVFTAHLEKATAKAFYIELKALVAEVGRNPADVIVLPGFSPIIGSTEALSLIHICRLGPVRDVLRRHRHQPVADDRAGAFHALSGRGIAEHPGVSADRHAVSVAGDSGLHGVVVLGIPRQGARRYRLPSLGHDPEKWIPVFG